MDEHKETIQEPELENSQFSLSGCCIKWVLGTVAILLVLSLLILMINSGESGQMGIMGLWIILFPASMILLGLVILIGLADKIERRRKNRLSGANSEVVKVGGISCTACKFCHSECPVNIDIAGCFSSYNELRHGSPECDTSMKYKAIPNGQRADSCIKCNACMSACLQHIDIPKELGAVASTFK